MQRLSFHLTFIILALISCTSNTENKAEEELRENPEVNLPDTIRDLKSLTIIPDSISTNRIRFEQETIFKDSDGGDSNEQVVYIGNMRNMGVDDEGRVYVAPVGMSSTKKIYVFSPDGTFLTSIGRSGRGPGEFIDTSNIEIQSNKLYVYDSILKRISIFSLSDFEYLDQIIIRPEAWKDVEGLHSYTPGRHFYPRDDGSILLEFNQHHARIGSSLSNTKYNEENEELYILYYAINSDSELISKQIFKEKDTVFGKNLIIPFEEANLPHTRSPIMAVGDDGKIYSAWTEDFLIRVYSPEGKYLRAIYYPFENSLLDSDEVLAFYNDIPQAKKVAVKADYPDTWPALNEILVDDENRLWISTITDSKNMFEWWVIDEGGKLLAKFNWPGERLERGRYRDSILEIRGGHLYEFDSEENSFAGDIVKYDFEFTDR